MRLTALFLAALGLLPLAGAAPDDERPRPNILFFLTDDQRFDFLGCAGHPLLQTPTIDGLAAAGLRFSDMTVSTSTCWISRASIFTGLYMRTHRYRTAGPLAAKWSSSSYPALLRQAGYRTAYVGKNHVNFEPGELEKMFDTHIFLRRHPYFKKQADGSLRHLSEITGDHAIAFLSEQDAAQPFCLSVSFNASHAEDGDRKNHYPYPKAVGELYRDQAMPLPKLGDPAIFKQLPAFLQQSIHRERFKWRWDTPEKYQHNMRNYLRMISGIDHVIGRVLRHLEEQELSGNTVIIYSADNGYYAGNRGFAGKWTHFEESLKVPLIIHDPRLPGSRDRVDAARVMNIDLAATMLDYAGVEVPGHYTGQSLKPFVDGTPPATWRSDSLHEFFNDRTTIPNWEGIRNQRYVYARYVDDRYEFLHDLERDPDQLRNYADNPEYEAILRAMRTRCDALTSQHGEKIHVTPRKKARKVKK